MRCPVCRIYMTQGEFDNHDCPRTLEMAAFDFSLAPSTELKLEPIKMSDSRVKIVAFEQTADEDMRVVDRQPTVTGRMDNSGPNPQNIPIRTEAARKLREAFLRRQEDVTND